LFLDEALEDPNGIIIIEWAQYLPEGFDVTRMEVQIEILKDSSRKIEIKKF
jgi:tRNA A37 threonylcarbamoyladenosine biosynthesis protein TsaE